MELKRRTFIRWLALAAAGLAGGGWWALESCAPRRWQAAIRARRYPGPVAPLDEQAVSHMGKWNG